MTYATQFKHPPPVVIVKTALESLIGVADVVLNMF